RHQRAVGKRGRRGFAAGPGGIRDYRPDSVPGTAGEEAMTKPFHREDPKSIRVGDYEGRIVMLMRQAVWEAVAAERQRCVEIVRGIPLPRVANQDDESDRLRELIVAAILGRVERQG